MATGVLDMSWLAFIFALELAILPEGYIQTYNTDMLITEDLTNGAVIKMEVEATLFDYFFIGGGMDCYMRTNTSQWPFFPTGMFYSFNAGARFKFLEVGFRHYCMHPVVPFLYYSEISPQWEGAYDEIYLRIEVGG